MDIISYSSRAVLIADQLGFAIRLGMELFQG